MRTEGSRPGERREQLLESGERCVEKVVCVSFPEGCGQTSDLPRSGQVLPNLILLLRCNPSLVCLIGWAQPKQRARKPLPWCRGWSAERRILGQTENVHSVLPLHPWCPGGPCTPWEAPGNGSQTVVDLGPPIHLEYSPLLLLLHSLSLALGRTGG